MRVNDPRNLNDERVAASAAAAPASAEAAGAAAAASGCSGDCCSSRTPIDEECVLLGTDHVGPGLSILELSAPRLSAGLLPGNFVHVLAPGMEAHVLRRPYSVLDVDVEQGTMEILVQEVGEGTRRHRNLAAGSVFRCLGPLGRPWPMPGEGSADTASDADASDVASSGSTATRPRALLVGGGVGSAPLLMQAKALVDAGVDVDVVLAARSAEHLACLPHFERVAERAGGETAFALHLCTDDGSAGTKGFAGPVAEAVLTERAGHGTPVTLACCCGPEPMMADLHARIRRLAAEGLPKPDDFYSLERRMACGIGACLSCVVDTKSGLRRSCVDGPVFAGEELTW